MHPRNVIDIAQDFSRFPAGRTAADGPYNADAFRENLLAPALRAHSHVIVNMNGVLGFSSAWLEQAFNGLVRISGFTPDQLQHKLHFISYDTSLVVEIGLYIGARLAVLPPAL